MTTTTMAYFRDRSGSPGNGLTEKVGKWSSFILCLAAIWLFAFVFAPWLQRHSSTVSTLSTYIEETGIDAGAVYYTEVEEVGDADLMIRDTFRFYLEEQKNK